MRTLPCRYRSSHLITQLSALLLLLLMLGASELRGNPITLDFSGVTTLFTTSETTQGVPDPMLFVGANIPVGSAFSGSITWQPVPPGPMTGPPTWTISVGNVTFDMNNPAIWKFDGVIDSFPQSASLFVGFGANMHFDGNIVQLHTASVNWPFSVGGSIDVHDSGNVPSPDHAYSVHWAGQITSFSFRTPDAGPSALLLLLGLVPLTRIARRSAHLGRAKGCA